MATYAHGNFEQIASAIGMEVGQIAKHENRFEAAAYWYRLDRRRPTRITPSKSREKLDRIAKAARRLLTSLGVNDPDEAADGPRDPEILNALVLAGEPNADAVIEATRRIGRLMEILDSIAAAARQLPPAADLSRQRAVPLFCLLKPIILLNRPVVLIERPVFLSGESEDSGEIAIEIEFQLSLLVRQACDGHYDRYKPRECHFVPPRFAN